MFFYLLRKRIGLMLYIQKAFFQETYYVPYKKLSNKKLSAKGKLYDKYTNYLRSLRTYGLAPQSRNVTKAQSKLIGIFLLPHLECSIK